MLQLACLNILFIFDGVRYIQHDGVAMGSPLGPTMASFALDMIEQHFDDYLGMAPSVYKRYVDDVFSMFDSRDDAVTFLHFLNSYEPKLQFTIEYETDGKLPFLDVLVISNGEKIETQWYIKPTNTGLYTPYSSYSPKKYKTNMIRCLYDRAMRICSSINAYKIASNTILKVFRSNGYSESFILHVEKSCIERHKQRQEQPQQQQLQQHDATDQPASDQPLTQPVTLQQPQQSLRQQQHEPIDQPVNEQPLTQSVSQSASVNIIYMKLLYTDYSHIHISKCIKTINDNLPENVVLQLVWLTYKTANIFPTKDKISIDLASSIVYQYSCQQCQACYIGQTIRHFVTRKKEHMSGRPTPSEVSLHSHTPNDANFSILKRSDHPFITESIYIAKARSNNLLNDRQSSYPLKIFYT